MSRLHSILRFLPLAFLSIALYLIHDELKSIDPHTFYRDLKAWRLDQIGMAILFTSFSFLCLTGYDRIALRAMGSTIPGLRIFFTAAASFAISNVVGHSWLSGSSVRMNSYTASGLSFSQVTYVAILNNINFWLGYGLLFSMILIYGSDLSTVAPWLEPRFSRTIGVLLFFVLSGFLGICFVQKGKEIRLRNFGIPWPRFQDALLGTLLGTLDLLFCAGVLYVLLPDITGPGLTFFHFLAFYLFAQTAGILSQVPGGLGVTDGLLLKLLAPFAASSQVLLALLLFRIIYYIAPLLVTLASSLIFYAWKRRESLQRSASFSRRFFEPFVAPALAFVTAGVGVILIISGIVPSIDTRIRSLERWILFPIIEISHIVSSVAGFTLIILAQRIWRRNHTAYRILLVFVVIGVVASLLKGFDWEEALVVASLGILLFSFRKTFYRRTSLSIRFGLGFDLGLAAILLGAIVLGLFVYGKVPYSNELWFASGVHANASRFLRSMAILLSLFFLFLLTSYTKRSTQLLRKPTPEELAAVSRILPTVDDTAASLALMGDKYLRISEDGKAFLMFGQQGQSWIVLGDVYGDPASSQALFESFLVEADQADIRLVFYECREAFVPRLLEAGIEVLKFGEEAHIPLDTFGLEGNHRKSLRAAYNRGVKDGLSFRVIEAADLESHLPQLRRISDSWLLRKSVKEKSFSLGAFSDEYMRRFPCAVVEAGGEIQAFANLFRGNGQELSVDLMRFDPERAPKTAMDYLFTSILLWGKEHGYRTFNMGMAPLSGIHGRPWAPLWYKVAQKAFDHGERFYNFKGLREYKEKYNPIWRSRYLGSDGGIRFVQSLADLALLISGGLPGMISRKAKK